MNILIEKNMYRHILLREFYKLTNGKTDHWFDLEQVAATKQIKGENFSDAYHYLLHEGLIEPYGSGHTSLLTFTGAKYLESLDELEGTRYAI